MGTKILIVEDEEEIAMLEKDYLEINGFETQVETDGEKAVELALTGTFDLILLDLMLPGKNGYDICREIRNKIDIPILMVTARTESIDKVLGLGIGADDYIPKPFDPAELVARVKSHLSRYERLTKGYRPQENEGEERDIIRIGNIEILTRSWKVYRDGEEIKFPNREFELLKFLAMNPNIVFSKEELFEKIWGYDYVGDSVTVTVHINRIREKIEEDSKNPKIIETVWGAGYRLNLE
ncbi:MAG: winged helix-turn-helix domain-containing protein [Lachnospiraceae bacterium]|nr:response regulator transcription factor [Lachnospiraceae bacterium]MDY5775420.1 response regulator transcription factor [Lachnospiraceae bacterium]